MRKWTKQPNVAVLQISQGEPRWQFLRQSHASILSKVCRQIINFQKCRWSEYSNGNGFKAFGQKVESRFSSESQPMSFSCKRSALLRTFRSPKNLRKRDLPIYSIRCIRQCITIVVHCVRLKIPKAKSANITATQEIAVSSSWGIVFLQCPDAGRRRRWRHEGPSGYFVEPSWQILMQHVETAGAQMLEDVDHILDKGQTTKWQKVAIV